MASEDRLIHLLLVALGVIRVGIAITWDQHFGTEATVALILMALGAVGLRQACRPRLPSCRLRRPVRGLTFGRWPR